jgi:hypothetical protein
VTLTLHCALEGAMYHTWRNTACHPYSGCWYTRGSLPNDERREEKRPRRVPSHWWFKAQNNMTSIVVQLDRQ